jgi:hypothetical protein
VDLGFGFNYDMVPELCGTLPALELCYSMSQRFQDEHQQQSKPEEPVATNWKISSPGKLRQLSGIWGSNSAMIRSPGSGACLMVLSLRVPYRNHFNLIFLFPCVWPSQILFINTNLQGSSPSKQIASGVLALVSQTKGIPTYMDDFKYGFPTFGLPRETMKWWGGAPAKDVSHELVTQDASTDDELNWGVDGEDEANGTITAEPFAHLCSI